MEEIDRVILELQDLRDTLRKEGERVSHEVARYTRLNQASMSAMKSIADSLIQRKSASQAAEHLTT
jgi:predicted RNase H-like nuclease